MPLLRHVEDNSAIKAAVVEYINKLQEYILQSDMNRRYHKIYNGI